MQIDLWTLAIQTVNFLIVVWLLTRFLYRPIRKVIEKREAADREVTQAAERKAQEAEAAKQALAAERNDLAKAQQQEIARLHAEMDKERQTILEAAKAKAEQLVAEARAQIGRERKQALADLADQIAGLARDLTETALGDPALRAGEGLRDHVAAHIDALPEADLGDVRRDLSAAGAGLAVVSSDPMPRPQQDRWQEMLATRFGGARVTFDTDPALLGGVELHFPHAVLRFTVADRLTRALEALKGGADGSE